MLVLLNLPFALLGGVLAVLQPPHRPQSPHPADIGTAVWTI
ncbi:MAG TPA: hypothetical protein VJ084_02545 [Nitrospinota bacterium]|nr:hypothetical protein [Nitrospinota bacterium]